ncbi:MAG: hypothetical protein IPM28_09435 [Chloracidobacterium sp.]|nr:hypothetical protein [Chloracidobacterium sp.]
MFPETEKKLTALTVEHKLAAERWAELSSSSTSLESFVEGFEARAGKPFDLDPIVTISKMLFKAGVAEGYSDPRFKSSISAAS